MPTLPIFPSDVKAWHDKTVGLVETMRMTADGFQLTAYGLGRMRGQKDAGAVSRRPMALPDALVHELYGLSEEETQIVEGERR